MIGSDLDLKSEDNDGESSRGSNVEYNGCGNENNSGKEDDEKKDENEVLDLGRERKGDSESYSGLERAG